MKAFLAIVRLTFRNSMRSYIFQLLLALLLFCVIFVPNVVSGDGTASGFIQVSLLYSLSAVILILSLSSIWLSCHAMTQDVDSYQLHMVISKPISRVTIWLGKFTGILLINGILLLVSTLSIYFIIQWQFHRQDFSAEEKAKIKNEVLVGRKVFMPDFPEDRINEVAREYLNKKITDARASNALLDTSPQALDKMLSDIKMEITASIYEAPFNVPKSWVYSGLPSNLDRPLFLRYKNYIGKISSKDQRVTRGEWFVGVNLSKEDENSNPLEKAKEDEYEISYLPFSRPDQLQSGHFYEKVLQPEWNIITPDGKLYLLYRNLDDNMDTQHFQKSDGPKLLMKVTGFAGNYSRAVLVIFLELIILTGLGCAAAAIFTMPTAIFVVTSYLITGSFASYMAGTSYFGGTADYIGYYVGKVLLFIITPIQKFVVTDLVANGELITFGLIGNLAFSYLILRALPFFLLGIFIYTRREMGLVIRK